MNIHKSQSIPSLAAGVKMLFATAAFGLLLLSGSQARTWTSSDGSKTFEGELQSYDPQTGILSVVKENGLVIKFKQDVLSEADIAYLKDQGSKPAPGPRTPFGGTPARKLPDELPDPDGKEADMSKPVQVFILMGQSNMLGFGNSGRLLELAKTDPKWAHLVDDAGNWTTRKDVRNVRVMNFQDKLNDWLSGANSGNFGPELQFGYLMGELIDAPVLILKSCIGNRSLGWDLLTPGSERFEFEGRVYAGYKDSPPSWPKGTQPKPINWYAGKQYDDDTASAKQVLKNLDKYYPGAKDYEIAGFVFWQGHKDQNAAHASRYEHNLVNFIKSLRKDFDAPDGKFACATIAFGGKGMKGHTLTVAEAQLAVSGDKGKYPEFKGNVKSVDVREFWRGGGAHYGGHPETYINVGNSLGRGMAELLQ